VHLDIGGGYAAEGMEGAEGNLEVLVEEAFTHYPPIDRCGDGEPSRGGSNIGGAERPVIVAGGGARSSGAGPEIMKLAEKLSIPVATSLNAKDILVDHHP